MKIQVHYQDYLGEIFLPEDNMFDVLDITICQFTGENLFHIRSKNFGDVVIAKTKGNKIILDVVKELDDKLPDFKYPYLMVNKIWRKS